MQGKTDVAAQSVAKKIEQDFSMPIKADQQYIASRHAGASRYGSEYSNTVQTVTRLRAIIGGDGEAEREIYDDLLPLKPNQECETDGSIFWKKL